ncbi:MAG TPA: TIGR01777 family oxidoreductase [Isosphaeraceae bacterium]|nr:TIGR01777 family oxidoreductase [Isosphaeraceae bacterium]
MRIFITGGSGLIGRNLARALVENGHQPVILSRNSDRVRRNPEMWPYQVIQGDPTQPGRWQSEVDGCDAVVNLAGHNLFAERWNAAVKAKIRDSRVHAAEQIVAAIQQARRRPKILVQGSAIGFYGAHGDEELTEASPSGSDFLAVVCRETEDVSAAVESLDVRRAVVRTGIVLARNEGALRFMTPIFKVLPGAPIGSKGGLGWATGQQWMSWIHLDDIVGVFRLAIDHDEAAGPLNGTAPHPVRNLEFAKTFSRVLRKPATPWRVALPFGPPDLMLQLMLGEVASVITTGQKVLPAKVLALGYAFRYPNLEGALRALFSKTRPPAQAPAHPVASGSGAHHA